MTDDRADDGPRTADDDERDDIPIACGAEGDLQEDDHDESGPISGESDDDDAECEHCGATYTVTVTTQYINVFFVEYPTTCWLEKNHDGDHEWTRGEGRERRKKEEIAPRVEGTCGCQS